MSFLSTIHSFFLLSSSLIALSNSSKKSFIIFLPSSSVDSLTTSTSFVKSHSFDSISSTFFINLVVKFIKCCCIISCCIILFKRDTPLLICVFSTFYFTTGVVSFKFFVLFRPTIILHYDDEDLKKLTQELTGKNESKEWTKDDASKIIQELKNYQK
ncbi:hypothetical protein CAAU_2488 [Caloramator australicus RC3]|uniref:Transmembrane protein n=1 Tax=Caloramator australicus RC3 TaxID=857293 RepID=I7KWK7_9CLOT|nr:hypothetical protein CAAU_2488 [Caloramator australicus RC3]